MKKKFLVSLMAGVAAICLTTGAAQVYAQAQEGTSYDIVSNLQMLEGASVRVSGGAATDTSKCGIRYTLTMDTAEYAALMADVGEEKTYSEVKFGAFVALAGYNVAGYEIANEAHLVGENAIYYWEVGKDEGGQSIFNVENPDTSKMKRIICVEGSQMTEKDGQMQFYGSVVNMKDENIAKNYIGIGYVKYTKNGETHYQFAPENNNVRSMEQVARIAYDKHPEYQEGLTELYLSKVAHTCEVVTAPVAKEGLKATGEAQELILAGVADEYANMEYSLDNETWSAEIPTATESDVYTVYYKAASKTAFDIDSEVQSITVVMLTAEGEITLAPAKIKENKVDNTIVGFGGTYEYVGLGEYKLGDVLEFSFTGQNIPNVGLFANKNGVNPVGGGTENTGIFLQTSGHGTSTFSKRLYIAGPFLADAGSAEPYHTLAGKESYVPKTELGKNIELAVDISNVGNTSLFGMDMLTAGTDYVYRVTTEESQTAGKVVVRMQLFTIANGERTQIADVSKEITHYLDSLESRYAVVYGAGSYYNQDITFAYEVNPEPVSGTLSLNAANVTTTTSGGAVVGFSGTYDYFGLGSYKVGDTLEFSFTGKNIPNLGLFVNKNGVNPVGGGTENTGIFMQTSGFGTSTFNRRLYIAGPFLLDAGSVDAYHTVSGLEEYAYKGELGKNKELAVDIKTNTANAANTSVFGIDFLTDGTDYVYRVTTEAAATGKVVIVAQLYTVTDGARTFVAEYRQEITHYLATLENTYAVVYGAGTYYGKTINFSYKVERA